LDPPRFCELFKVLNAGVGMIRLETPSGLIASYNRRDSYFGSESIESYPSQDAIDPSLLEVVLISDAFSVAN
jgi:hypothetical protein